MTNQCEPLCLSKQENADTTAAAVAEDERDSVLLRDHTRCSCCTFMLKDISEQSVKYLSQPLKSNFDVE